MFERHHSLRSTPQARGEYRGIPLKTWVIHVREIDPPAGVEPVEWILLTHVAVLSGRRLGRVRLDWSVQEFYDALARLGGHPNRRQDPPPSRLVLWRGWTNLQPMVAGASAVGYGREVGSGCG